MTVRHSLNGGVSFICTTCGFDVPPGPAAMHLSEHVCPACPVCGVVETVERGRSHKPSCLVVASEHERHGRLVAALERCAFELSECAYELKRIREWTQR